MVEAQVARSLRYPSPPIQLANGEITLHEMHNRFAQTEFGQRLQQNVRFERFKPAHVSNEEWQRLLGMDVNNYDHMKMTTQVVQHFLQSCREDPFYRERGKAQFTAEDESKILVTGQLHDLIEGMEGFRDISFDLKTTKDEDDELGKMTEFIPSAAAYLCDDPEDQAVLTQKLLAVPEILRDRTSVCGQAFNAIERLGYMRTGYRAWQVGQRISDEVTASHLQWITSNVLANQTETVLAYAAKYHAVKVFLRERNHGISEAFTTMPASVFSLYGKDEQVQKDKFMEAKARWNRALCYRGNGISPEQNRTGAVDAQEVVYVRA
jgi:hypothetical protein